MPHLTQKPELLAPAGDMEKLKAAVIYGADAVYLAGQSFGLRAFSKNFDLDQMADAINYAHDNGVKVYVTANIFARDADFAPMGKYLKQLEAMQADAVIVADPGVFNLARTTAPNLPVHISTQANNTNSHTATFWHKLGAERVVLARELSLEEIAAMSPHLPVGLELEAFVHGAMCMSYSGRCMLSASMTGRDANRGACAQPCRWQYGVVEQTRPGEVMPVMEDERGTYIFNAKDLCMIEHIPALVAAGVQSFKIEGRMKSPYYVACVVDAYRRAIDDFFADPNFYAQQKNAYVQALQKTSHRSFTTGFFFPLEDGESLQYTQSSAYTRGYDFVGLVLDYDAATQTATIEQRNRFVVGDTLDILRAKQPSATHTVTAMTDGNGTPIASAPHPQQILKMQISTPLKPFDMLRKKSDSGK